MKSSLAGLLAFVVILGVSRTAEARNPHCAGGIQYWSQWRADKVKGNMEDYQRELTKSIQQLEMCAEEDPKDFEAMGYLGFCYAEADSACAAGRAFAAAIAGLESKGDKKGKERVEANRDSYWADAFNSGIKKIEAAQKADPEFCKPAAAGQEKAKADAGALYDEALAALNKAACLKPGESRTMRNLGTVHAFKCEYVQAEKVFLKALETAPRDSDLVASLRAVRVNIANQLIDAKQYDEAIKFFSDLSAGDPKDPNLLLGLADAHFKKAQAVEGDLRKKEFKAAGDAYSKAASLKPGDYDLPFNAALAYQNADEPAFAKPMWEAVLKMRPDDMDATTSLGSCLADLNQFDEAIQVLSRGLRTQPKNKLLHRQLGSVFTKAGNNKKSTESFMVYLALHNGQAVPDAAVQAKKAAAGSAAAKTLAGSGSPEDVYPWAADGENYETWFYWSKHQAYHFKGGALVEKSDWSGGAGGASGK